MSDRYNCGNAQAPVQRYDRVWTWDTTTLLTLDEDLATETLDAG